MNGAPQPVKFLLVGIGGYVVNVAAFTTLVGGGIPYLAASLSAFFASNALMYVGNRSFTFRLGHGLWQSYTRYLAVGCIVAVLNTALLASLVEGAGMDPRIGQALSLAALTPISFFLNKCWTFQLEAA